MKNFLLAFLFVGVFNLQSVHAQIFIGPDMSYSSAMQSVGLGGSATIQSNRFITSIGFKKAPMVSKLSNQSIMPSGSNTVVQSTRLKIYDNISVDWKVGYVFSFDDSYIYPTIGVSSYSRIENVETNVNEYSNYGSYNSKYLGGYEVGLTSEVNQIGFAFGGGAMHHFGRFTVKIEGAFVVGEGLSDASLMTGLFFRFGGFNKKADSEIE